MRDYTIEEFTKFKQYLNAIDKMLSKYFEEQKDFICCKSGCSYCCENGQYPLTEIEFKFLLLGFFKIEPETRQKIIRQIKKVKFEYQNCENKKEYMYTCPFLGEDKKCTVYDYRPLICRIFGLIIQHESGKYTLPYCQKLGLNYSTVYNEETKKLDYDKVEELGYKSTPGAYRVNLKRLTSADFIKDEKIDFGEFKSLVEWL